ncbi:hypothetical protein FPQ18DRAFT_421186 [Pyronema domesticum]|nr:hypothetical protein FPQ18DRAFT_421186 [Pyronema domesticum]
MNLLFPLISFLAISYAAPMVPSDTAFSGTLDPEAVTTKPSALMHSILASPEDHQATTPPAAISASSVPSALSPIGVTDAFIKERQADFSINTDEVINHAADLLHEMLKGSASSASSHSIQTRQVGANLGNLQAIIDAATKELIQEIRGPAGAGQNTSIPGTPQGNLQAIIDAGIKELIDEILRKREVQEEVLIPIKKRQTSNSGNLQAIIDAAVQELLDEIRGGFKKEKRSGVIDMQDHAEERRQLPANLQAIIDAATKELVKEIRGPAGATPAAGAGVEDLAAPAAPTSGAAGNATSAGPRGNLQDIVDAGVRELVEEIRGGF